MQKQFKRWYESCENCGGPTQVRTEKPGPCCANQGDLGRCTRCYCTGTVDVDPWGLYIDWGQDMCAKCHRDMEAGLDRITTRVIEILSRKAS